MGLSFILLKNYHSIVRTYYMQKIGGGIKYCNVQIKKWRIPHAFSENTKEGMEYLAFNDYSPICRITESLWLVRKIGNKLGDVKIIR